METFFLLMFGHFVADYALQSPFTAREKSHLNGRDPAHPEQKCLAPWYQVLLAHCWLHAGAVFLATQSLTLALFELAAHWCIDYSKCAKRLTFNQDQVLHYACKAVWAILFALIPGI